MDALEHEILAEKAGGLARAERRLLAALDVYREQHADDRGDATWALVDAVTCFVVQREACGLRDARQIYEWYRVPAEVVARMGVRRGSPA
jgi:Family of unknown function (DUF6665)